MLPGLLISEGRGCAVTWAFGHLVALHQTDHRRHQEVTDHHAISPTGVRPRNLGAHDQLVYDAITTQFIAAFYPVCVKHVTTVVRH